MAARCSANPYSPDKLIRFHVIANSNSPADQALKLKVKDAVVRAMSPVLARAGNINEARERVDANLDFMASVATGVLRENGCPDPVSVMRGRFQFPVKTYSIKGTDGTVSKLTLPAGEYEAVRVVIGKGKGANWWCVLFPPLCFVDQADNSGTKTPASAGSVEVKKCSSGEAGAVEPDVEYRFKVVEWYRKIKALL